MSGGGLLWAARMLDGVDGVSLSEGCWVGVGIEMAAAHESRVGRLSSLVGGVGDMLPGRSGFVARRMVAEEIVSGVRLTDSDVMDIALGSLATVGGVRAEGDIMMPASVECYFLEETVRARRGLRRCDGSSGGGGSCEVSETGYHDARVDLDIVEVVGDLVTGDSWPHDDARWPRACVCGKEFGPGDFWQLTLDRVYRRADGRGEMTWREAPPGAMRWMDWILEGRGRLEPGPGTYVGPDGHALQVKTPGGDWDVDGPSVQGGGWTRTGEVPRITVSPSILIGHPPRYHGWLRDGWLVPC